MVTVLGAQGGLPRRVKAHGYGQSVLQATREAMKTAVPALNRHRTAIKYGDIVLGEEGPAAFGCGGEGRTFKPVAGSTRPTITMAELSGSVKHHAHRAAHTAIVPVSPWFGRRIALRAGV